MAFNKPALRAPGCKVTLLTIYLLWAIRGTSQKAVDFRFATVDEGFEP